jgi:phosphoglycolate phosphatase-like HAD superfamily hydrolase
VLILFDIDGTLLRSEGAGVQAMQDAARELFGARFTFDGIEIAGRLDMLIWSDACRLNGIPDSDAAHARFRETYGRRLRQRLANGARVTLLPGVEPLVRAIAGEPGLTLGLLTGNYPETGRMKIAAGGLDPGLFSLGAWGCDARSRRDLPPVALARAREMGRGVSARQVVIVGDTPHDVDCAKAHGCRAIGVATGRYTLAELQACGPDLAVPSLSATDNLLRWIMHPADAGCL